MSQIRKRHSSSFKAKVALEAIKEIKTMNELASQYGVHQVQISRWKKELLEALPSVFIKDRKRREVDWMNERDTLYRQIGEVTVERDWLKKKLQGLV